MKETMKKNIIAALLVCGFFLSAGLAWAQDRNDRVTLAAKG